jgi:hypothetical protein
MRPATRPRQELDTDKGGGEQAQAVQAAAGGGLVRHAGMLGRQAIALPALQRPPIGLQSQVQPVALVQRLDQDFHGGVLGESL